MKLVAVTSCPTGIAHSEMAAESLEQAAAAAGHEITVEVQGASGAAGIDQATLDSAEAVIFAVDATVRDRDRFAHLPAVNARTREAIDHGADLIDRAVAAAAQREPATAGAPAAAQTAAGDDGDGELIDTGQETTSKVEEVRRWLMTGVSYMIPFVVAGGIMIALAFALGGAVEVTETDVYEDLTLAALLLEIGNTAFSMLVPILAGFIAYAMADRPGLAPGIVGGLIAVDIEAGFLGGLVAGLLAGATVMLLKRIPVSGPLKKMMPTLVYPLIGCFIVGALMIVVVGEPIAALTGGLEDWLAGLEGGSVILLGAILGIMMAFDMGGPVNKVAYAFGIAALEAGEFAPMAAVMAAGMTPPLGLALSSRLRPNLYTPAERRAGDAGWVMGASFITEGAIPFAAGDPIRVIPSLMAGSGVAAALSLAFDATLQAPHGGLFVVGLIGNWPLYLLAIVIGTLVTAALVTGLKSLGRTSGDAPAETGKVATDA